MSQQLTSEQAIPQRDNKPLQFRLITRSYFFLGTLSWACIGWGLALISQAVVAAEIGNAPVGVMWFAILVQPVIIIGLLFALASDTLALHRPQLANFASIVVVFAVIGVDRNIYSSTKSQRVMAGGWLITAIVDILWVLHFTADESSPILRLFKAIGQPPQRHSAQPSAIPSVSTNLDAFKHLSSSTGGTAGAGAGLKAPDSAAASKIRADGRTGSGLTVGNGGPGSQTGSGARLSSPRPYTTTTANAATPEPSGPTLHRAEALYDYKGSSEDPSELSFTKGEVLEIIDESGKWWEARKADGTKGIAPSNYLRIL